MTDPDLEDAEWPRQWDALARRWVAAFAEFALFVGLTRVEREALRKNEFDRDCNKARLRYNEVEAERRALLSRKPT